MYVCVYIYTHVCIYIYRDIATPDQLLHTCCSVLQCGVLRCMVEQSVAVWGCVLHHIQRVLNNTMWPLLHTCCSVLQCCVVSSTVVV